MKLIRNWKHRHWGGQVAIGALLGSVVTDWIPMPLWGHRIAGVIGILAIGAGAVMTASHRVGALCEDCIEAMPLDGPEAAQRRKGRLRLFHKIAEKPGGYIYLGTIAVLLTVGAFFKSRSAPGLIMSGLAALCVAGHIGLQLLHQRLQPWCPFCHWDDGGEKEPSPDPIVPETV